MKTRVTKNLGSLSTLAMMSLFGLGCAAVGPDYVESQPLAPEEWRIHGNGESKLSVDAPLSLARWWTTLEDPLLTALITSAVEANLDLRTADLRLREARAQRELSGAGRFPTLDGASTVSRSGTYGGGQPDGSTERAAGSFDAAWEIDVFGGQRRAIEAADADEQVAKEARRDTLVSVLGEVALNYTELRTFQARHGIAQANLRNQEENLQIVRAQYDAGAATAFDLERASASVSTAKAQIPPWIQQLNRAKNRITTLLGELPGSRDDELDAVAALPVPDVNIAVGVPADVLRRRPDVRQAERQLAAETARVGVATADLYPNFILSGSIGVESLSLAGVSALYQLGPEIRWPVFNSGRIRQKIEVQNAIQERALVAYEASVLNALEEVENALGDFAHEQVRLRLLRNASRAAQRSTELAQERYRAGAVGFLDVLDAQRTLLTADDDTAASEGAVVTNLVKLYKALGGGWESLEEHDATLARSE